MATTTNITVNVKTMSGDIICLEISPSLGLKDIANKLSLSDPVTFPQGLTVLSFIDEEKQMTNDTMLMAMVQPGESIVRVDTFTCCENCTAYRFRIQADRTISMWWMHDQYQDMVTRRGSSWYSSNVREEMDRRIKELILRRQYPQLFDICYCPVKKAFTIPFQGVSLERLRHHCSRGDKGSKTLSNVLRYRDRDGYIVYSREGVGLHEFDDDISRLPTEDEQNDWSEFMLTNGAIERISTMVTKWISKHI